MAASIVNIIVLIMHAHQGMSPGAQLLFGSIIARRFQRRQIVSIDVASHIIPVKDRTVELIESRVDLAACCLQVFQILIENTISTDQLTDLSLAAAMGDQLVGRRHIDTIDIRVANRRSRRGEVYLVGAGITRHLDNLLAGGATYNGVVYQQDILAL